MDKNRTGRRHFDIIEAAMKNDFKAVDEALKHDPDAINAQRPGTLITPLIGAAGRGLERMVGHLLSKDNVDVSIKDAFGKSAFDHGRLFPEIVGKLVLHKYPDLQWQEPCEPQP